MEIIKTKEEWEWYLKRLDAAAKYNHRHQGTPEKFPCKVESEWGDDPNGPYFYQHRFLYQEEKSCEKCGHKHNDWQVS